MSTGYIITLIGTTIIFMYALILTQLNNLFKLWLLRYFLWLGDIQLVDVEDLVNITWLKGCVEFLEVFGINTYKITCLLSFDFNKFITSTLIAIKN